MPRTIERACHVCGARYDLKNCERCGLPACRACSVVGDLDACLPCATDRGDLGTLADTMLATMRRFAALLALEQSTIALREVAPDIADAHRIVLDLETALPNRLEALEHPSA